VSAVDGADVNELVAELFRRESAHLVSALVRLLGPRHLALAEDVVQEALFSAMQAWRFGLPDNPKAWILQVAKRRAIDLLRRERRLLALSPDLDSTWTLDGTVELVLSPDADAQNQLALMFTICDGSLAPETHVSLILRLLCGLSAREIAAAFLVDVETIDRRLHRGRARLQQLGELREPSRSVVEAVQPSVEAALYLLFNEGYHGSQVDGPLRPELCAEALRLVTLLLSASGVEPQRAHALAALFCFHAARLGARLDQAGALVPLADQDRTTYDRELFEQGVRHLAASAGGDVLTRWHLEAGIAYEHTSAASLAATNWHRIARYYDALYRLAPSPVVALNRALVSAELEGLAAGRAALLALSEDPKLAAYSFFWAARADIERRAGRSHTAHEHYRRALSLARTEPERRHYERRLVECAAPDLGPANG
jgi:RNA polymerase sigma-70 factor (ECF subfamily)